MKSKWSQTKINGKNRRKERKVGNNSNRNSGDQNRSPEFLSPDLTHWAKVTLKYTAKKLRTAECSDDRQNECVECYCTKVHLVCWPAPSAVDWHQPTHTHRSLVFNVLIYIYYLLIIFKSMPPALLILFFFFRLLETNWWRWGGEGKQTSICSLPRRPQASCCCSLSVDIYLSDSDCLLPAFLPSLCNHSFSSSAFHCQLAPATTPAASQPSDHWHQLALPNESHLG